MKILSEKEVASYGLPEGPSKNPCVAEVKKLKVGQVLLIEKGEWKRATPPSVMLGGCIRNGMKFSTRTLKDGSGWLVTRIR